MLKLVTIILVLLGGYFLMKKLFELMGEGVAKTDQGNVEAIDEWADQIVVKILSKRLSITLAEAESLLKDSKDPSQKRRVEENLGSMLARFDRNGNEHKVCLMELIPGTDKVKQWEKKMARESLPAVVREEFMRSGKNAVTFPWVFLRHTEQAGNNK